MPANEGETRRPFVDGIAARERPADGERVLWIHGYTMDASTWGELWDLLPEWHHIGIDLPGHGHSRSIRVGEDLVSVARDLGAAAGSAGARHLVALSFGTMVALQIAIEYPDAFATVVLGAPAIAGGPQDAAAGNRYVEMIQLRRRRVTGPQLAAAWMRSPPDIFKGAESHPELHARLAAVIGRHRWEELDTGAMRALTGPPQTESQLRRVRATTRLVLGDGELPPFRRSARFLVETLYECDAVEIRDAGHLCLLERPREAAQVIASVVDGV